MKSAVLTVLLAVAICAPTIAVSQTVAGDQASVHLATARKFVEVIGAKATLTSSINAVVNSLPVQLKSTNPNIGEDTIALYQQTFREEYAQDMDGLLDQVAQVYAKHFSEKELQTLIAFYSSEPGKSFIAGTPSVANDITELQDQIQLKIVRKIADQRAVARKARSKSSPK